MLQKISSVFVVYRRKTLTGSLDPMHANGTDKTLHNWWRTQPVGSVHRRGNMEEADTPETKVSTGLGYCKSEYLVRE